MLFVNRHDAAERLSRALLPWKGRHPLILAIPRGALEIGRVIADRLEGDLDVVLVRKLRAPLPPNLPWARSRKTAGRTSRPTPMPQVRTIVTWRKKSVFSSA